MTQPIFLIADDLSGALDSSACFARAGRKVSVALSLNSIVEVIKSGADVIAVSTGSREGSEQNARTQIRSVLAHIPKGAQIIKKIDSRLKGHVAAETEELLSQGFTRILVAPAIPKMGRLVKDGKLSGSGVSTPLPIKDVFAGLNCEVIIPDINSDTDLDTTVFALERNTLVVGASGMSEAIARAESRSVEPLNVPHSTRILIAIGSRDPITITQVDNLLSAHSGIEVVACPNGRAPKVLSNATVVLAQLTQGESKEPSVEVTERFAQTLANIVLKMRPDTIVASGGETAQGILAALEVNSLDLIGEAYTGIPVSYCEVSEQNLTVITKSGGFGGPSLLTNLLSDLQE